MEFEINIILESFATLLECCRKYRIEGQHSKAYHCYLTAMMVFNRLSELENKTNVKIFKGVLPQGPLNGYYAFLEEFTIFSFYLNKVKEGLLMADKLLFSYNAGVLTNKNQIANNQRFYMASLGSVAHDKKRIRVKCAEFYNELNPSIISVKGGYLMNCRTSNFGVKPGGIYYTRTPDGIVNTKNYILELDNNFNIKSQIEIIDRSKCDEFNVRPIKGLEDVIIFIHQDELWCTCTTLDTNPEGIPQITLCKLTYCKGGTDRTDRTDRIEKTEEVELSKEIHTEFPAGAYEIHTKRPMYLIEDNRAEKNWLPFSHSDQIKFIYSYSPTRIRIPVGTSVEITKELGYLSTELLIINDTQLNFDRFRGSGGPVMLETQNGSGWLIVVHEVSWCQDQSRIYTHRFVLMNNKFEIIKISDPWFFEAHGIEFCRSMCLKGNNLVLTCGLKDEEAWCYIIDKNKVLSGLRELKDFGLGL